MLQSYTNDYLEIYFDKYKALPVLKKELGNKYNPVNLFVETSNYVILFENEEQPDRIKSGEESTDLPPIPTLDGDQIKEGRKLKFLTPKKTIYQNSDIISANIISKQFIQIKK